MQSFLSSAALNETYRQFFQTFEDYFCVPCCVISEITLLWGWI